MIQRLGKYRVVERIGRGGMGTVYKAHDPMLDRTVALKVISADIDVTDDLRTRFFREAQACARLSHPNVITVYDMGDENGHLYIVMEFLEGDELRQLIAQHRNILLEDKLAMMIEVCDGLDYAHKRGIVHRDIKPGNIYVLKDGHIKLLDFGIARIATAEAGLTRTGLIMGTLRYMSPEQARGRVDHRSDIFSVGAVFYEFLTYQHAFPGNDPMEILERLRSEDPTPLTEIDPSMPAELSDIIARSLRKDPGERYAELAHMRVELERVRLQLTEDADRLRVRVRARFEEIRRLQGTLTERIGQSFEDETVPVVDTRITVATLSSLERMAVTKAERLRQVAEQAEALRAAFEESLGALEAGRVDEAIRGLERIVADMPDHLRAAEALHRAREAQAAAARARDVLASLVRQAEAALEQGQPERSLELLRGAGDVPAGAAELGAEVARVREAAERAAERAREEAARKALEQARAKSHEMGVQAAAARERAEGVQAEKYAAAAWAAAAATQQQGTAAQQQHQYEDAARLLREAADEYDRAATAAFEAAEAEARRVEALTREAAGLSEAGRWAEALARLDEGLALMPEHAPATQLRARVEAAQAASIRTRQRISAVLAQAEAALQEGQPARAQEVLQHVGELPAGAQDLSAEVVRVRGAVERALVEERARQEADRAQAAARQALERARAKADKAAKRAAAARERAEQAHAGTYVAAMMTRAVEQQRQATAAYERQEYDEAARLLAEVAHEYDDAVTAAARESVAALAREAEAALEQGQPARSLELLRSVGDVSAGVPDLAAEVARVREAAERELAAERARQEAARKALEQARAKSHEMGVQAVAARERADGVQAEKYAAAAWAAAAATQQQGTAAQQQHQYEEAARLFREAADEYDRAATAAFEAAEAEARRVEALTREAAGLSEAGRWAEALARLDEGLALMPEHGAAIQLRARVEASQAAAIRTQQRISAVLAQAEAALQEGEPARGLELLQHVGEQPAGAEDLSAEVVRVRSALEQAVAAERARHEAERTRQEAERVRQEAERARQEAERAQAAARKALEQARAKADEAAKQVVDARHRAEQAHAATYVAPMMTRAAEQQRQAQAAYERQEYDEAARLFAEAAREYDGAVVAARTAQTRRVETLASEAGALFESGRWVEAQARLDEALALAPEHARAKGLRDRVAAARESVAAMTREAEAALAQGQPARSLELLRSVGDVAAGAPDLAAEVARVRGAAERAVAAERARQEAARKALEQARAKSQEMGVQAAAARRRAEGVKAAKYSAAAWTAAAATQQRGTEAQEQQQYEDAARFFREAAGEYDRAATAAFEAAAAEARRVEALTREAAGLSEAGHWAEALARLDEGLALVPEHAPATQLRARVEAARAAAARTRQRISALLAQAEAALQHGQPARGLELLQSVGELPAGAADLSAEVERVRGALKEALAAERARQEAAAQRKASERPQRETDDREAVQRPADVPVPVRRRVPPVAIGIGAAAVVVIGLSVYWQTSSTRPTPVPTPPEATAPAVKGPPSTLASGELEAVEALRKQVTARRQAAVLAGAELRAAATFASATEKERAADAAVNQRDWPVARSAYNEALSRFEKASAESAALARQEEEAQRARDQMNAARRAADVGGAARLAQGPWTKATETQRSAEAALKQGEMGKAQALFAESAKAYQDADKAASDTRAADAQRAELAAVRQKLQAAEGAAAAAANARRSAEQSAASRYAPKAFALAQKKEDEGRKGLDRKEYESAESRLREAARDYQAALQEAQRAAETERQRTAEAERQRAAEAERQRVAEAERQKAQAERQRAAEAERQRVAEAERQKAAEAERQRAAEAQRQRAAEAERQRLADVERQRVAEAERQKAEAERQVVAARQRQEAEQARRSTADVRAKAHADREQAVKAGADVLVKDVFASAAARESEGDRLAAAQDMVAARQAYQDAAERYGDAGRRARIVQEAKAGADQARARMTAEKERARPDAPEWSAAVAQERQATQHYQRFAYREAGESFVAATGLFAKAVARPPERAPERRPTATDEVRGVLDAYVRAFETKDISLMQKVRPGLKSDEVRRLRDSFEQSRDYKVSLKVDSLNVTGDEAVVKGRREDNLVSRSGQAFRNESSFTFRLKRTSGGWVIDAVN